MLVFEEKSVVSSRFRQNKKNEPRFESFLAETTINKLRFQSVIRETT